MISSSILCALLLLLAALMAQYFLVIEENFQTQRTSSRRPSARARRGRRTQEAEAPAPAPAPAPAQPTTTTCPPCPSCPTAVDSSLPAGMVAPAAVVASTVVAPTPTAMPTPTMTPPTTPTTPPTAPLVAQKPTDVLSVDQKTAPVNKQESMRFSELINSLIASKPIEDANKVAETKKVSGQVSGQESALKKALEGSPVTVDKELAGDVQSIKTGVKDIQNLLLSSRSSTPVIAETPVKKTNALEQGQWFRSSTDGSCPYAQGQTKSDSVMPFDMNDYIRKDSIPCWGCTLK